MKEKFRNFLNNTDRVDLKIILAVTFLCAFGCMMVYSASSYVCSTSENFNYDGTYLLKRQLIFIAVGFILMLAAQYANYHILYMLKGKIYLISVILILLLLTPLGEEANGAVRWLKLGPITIHVGEVTKIFLIVFLAYMMAEYTNAKDRISNVIRLWMYAGVLCGMILVISSNLSTALIMVMIAFGMTFIWSNTTKFHLTALGAAVVVIGAGLLWLYFNLPEPEAAAELHYQIKRILGWMAPEKYKDVFSDQILQSLYAVGSGGLFGKGLGNSVQKMSKIPEPQNDMIFAIICEELGIFGALIVLILLGYLILQLIRVAMDASDLYGGLIAGGVALHLSFQTIVNVSVALNVFPNTGVSLPFISYGGSSMVLMMCEIGLVLSIRRYRMVKSFKRQLKTQKAGLRYYRYR